MWRNRLTDTHTIHEFLKNLTEFQQLKKSRWERLDDQVQMSITPGTPTEDWIIPPDENKTRQILEIDPDYVRLKKDLIHKVEEVKKIASFLNFDTHHDYDWLKFTNPLIGNSALEDIVSTTKKLHHTSEHSQYFFKNLIALFK